MSHLLAGSFRSAGIEQFTIDKTRPLEFRQIVNHPRRSCRRATIFAFAVVAVVAVAVMGVLLATGALAREDSPSSLATVATPTPSPTIVPSETLELAPQPTGFKIVGIIVPTSPPPSTPRPQNWRLETAVKPERSGSVGMSPPKQEPLYSQGDAVELTANCNSGFVGWEGDVPASSEKTDNPILVIMDKPRTLYAFCVEPALAAYSAGAELVFAGEYEAAIEKLNKAIRLDPRHAPAYSSRGFAYIHTGGSQEAIQDYDKAIRLAPETRIWPTIITTGDSSSKPWVNTGTPSTISPRLSAQARSELTCMNPRPRLTTIWVKNKKPTLTGQ